MNTTKQINSKYRLHDMESSIVNVISGRTVAECLNMEIAEEFINAVNNHEKLVEALKRAIDCEKRNGILSLPCIDQMNEALKTVED